LATLFQALKSHDTLYFVFCTFFNCRLPEVYRIRISGLESGRSQHILNKPDRIRTTVLFKFPVQDQDFRISLFGELTPTQSQKEFLQRFKGCNAVRFKCKCERDAVTPDVLCTAAHQSSTIASLPSGHYQAQYNVMSDYICKL